MIEKHTPETDSAGRLLCVNQKKAGSGWENTVQVHNCGRGSKTHQPPLSALLGTVRGPPCLGSLFRRDFWVLCMCLCKCVFTHIALLFQDNSAGAYDKLSVSSLVVFLTYLFLQLLVFKVSHIHTPTHTLPHIHTDNTQMSIFSSYTCINAFVILEEKDIQNRRIRIKTQPPFMPMLLFSKTAELNTGSFLERKEPYVTTD